MPISNSKKTIIVVLAISVLLGLIASRQFLLSEKIKKEVSSESNQSLAFEVAELFNSNEQLKSDIEKLSSELDKLEKTYIDSKQANEALDSKIEKYETILGIQELQGGGVRIEFDKKVASIQIVDLINALKNIGVNAISINGNRILLNSSIAESVFPPPLTIEAIGDKNLLYNSLTRSGGIIDQIGYGQTTIVDDMILPSK